jgi:hypothetical protein
MTNHGGKGGWRLGEGQVKEPTRRTQVVKKWRDLMVPKRKEEGKKWMMKRQEKEE